AAPNFTFLSLGNTQLFFSFMDRIPLLITATYSCVDYCCEVDVVSFSLSKKHQPLLNTEIHFTSLQLI
ncbi:hypothetical protein L9F63_020413, partial [Diploptera punctata]